MDSKIIQRFLQQLTLKNLRILLGVVGLVPIFLGTMGILSGLERLIPDADFTSAADGQYRYLSAIYLGFGCLIIWIQSRLASEVVLFRIMMAMVFVAGIARALPLFEQDLPSFSILVALAFELVAPPLLVIWHNKVIGTADG